MQLKRNFMLLNKYKLVPAFILAVAAGFTSCTQKLDQLPQTNINDANFWNSPADLQLACNYLYTGLPENTTTAMQDNMSDYGFGTAANPVSDGARVVPATSAVEATPNAWVNNYKQIYSVNNILEKSLKIKQGDAASINKYLAEARFFRAFSYFELVKRYGDVPLILRTIALNEDTLLFPHRSPRAVVIDSVYADLDFAAQYLPQPDVQPASEFGRITATAALAFKARVALFEGTRQKFFGYGNPMRHLQLAVDASDAVITGGKHALYTGSGDSSYYYLFQYKSQAKNYTINKEDILMRLYGQNQANNISSHIFSRLLEQSALTATKSFMDAYLYKDGLPQGKSPFYKPVQDSTLTEFMNRDPRIGMTVFSKRLFFISSLYTPTLAYKIAKYFNAQDWNTNPGYIDFILLRYAEVLLTYAEAKYELNNSISDDDLDKSINKLRARVNMPALTNAFVNGNGLDMRMEIRRERSTELAFEGFRYWDLLRWKTAEVELPKQMLGPKYFPLEQPQVAQPGTTPDGFVIFEKASQRSFRVDRDYLWPIPTYETGVNVNLTQNPKW
jgi:starch-binding outer membrane protein, SusD/RagB family